MGSDKVKKLTRLAMLTAISVVLVAIIHFPIFPAASYLEYDPADVPVLLAGILYGPAAGVAVTCAAAIVQGLTVSSGSGIIGIIMHIIATGCCCFTVAVLCKRSKEQKLVLPLAAGVVVMTVMMALCNLVFTPVYTGLSVEAVAGMLIPIIVPFNLLKAGVNSVITYVVYNGLRVWLSKESKE